MDELRPTWDRTRGFLTDARAALPAGVSGEPLDLFDEYLAHNELGLAFDILAYVAGQSNAGRPCWAALLAALREMGLREDDDLYGRAVGRVLRRATGEE